MAVAVKHSPETTSPHALSPLAVGSWAGIVFLLGSIGLVFYGIPFLWETVVTEALRAYLGVPVILALQILAMVGVGSGLVILGRHLLGPAPQHGLKAGIFVGTVEVVVIALLGCWFGALAEGWLTATPMAGIGITVGVSIVLLVAAVYFYFRPQFEQRLLQLEDQGWFTIAGYKRTQGQRVRRGTILGILAVAVCGIYVLLKPGSSLISGPKDWQVRIPFTYDPQLHWVLLPDVQFTVPLLLAAVSLWLAYRVVNLPVFADFLIATEAELNKVSWTTRKRLVQDTIVVLVTVVLLTVFLFVVDQLWGFLLERVGVIQITPAAATEQTKGGQSW
jgi:preprotein translocase SecE subunit